MSTSEEIGSDQLSLKTICILKSGQIKNQLLLHIEINLVYFSARWLDIKAGCKTESQDESQIAALPEYFQTPSKPLINRTDVWHTIFRLYSAG